MHPEEIKAAIRMKGTTPSAVADELGISRTTVSQVIHGRGVSDRVATRISQVLGIPKASIWPDAKPTLMRRTKPKLVARTEDRRKRASTWDGVERRSGERRAGASK